MAFVSWTPLVIGSRSLSPGKRQALDAGEGNSVCSRAAAIVPLG
ncbi:hypothetical protein [Streptomyces graminofaciens]|nr:hypothetical protein [Streptomyces graminofaciens]